MNKEPKLSSGRNYGGMSMQQRRLQRRTQFLAAGKQVFGTLGFRRATVRLLCREAKLTDRYFYESYSGLEHLLQDVYRQLMWQLGDAVLRAMFSGFKQGGLPTAIEDGVTCFFTQIEDPKLAKICMLELEGVSDETNALYNGYIKRFARTFMRLAKQAGLGKTKEKESLDVIGIAIVGVLRQTATHWLLSEYKPDRAVMIKTTQGLFNGVLAELKS